MKRFLVTGVNGFVGQHLVQEIHASGYEVTGLGYGEFTNSSLNEILTSYKQCDLTDKEQVESLDLEDVSVVINLAGLARVGDSFKNPALYEAVNVQVLTNIGEELLRQRVSARVIAVSTGAVYDPAQPMPLSEDSLTTAVGSPYAKSKLLMEQAATALRKKGLDCVVVRPFNHIGPGQDTGFLLPDLYTKIMAADKQDQIIKVGNLMTKRDYTDVRDIVRAYTALAVAPKLNYETYNVCSGKSHSGQEILDLLLSKLSLSEQIAVEVDQSLIRPNDPLDLYGSHERLHKETGWQPKIQLQQTISDFIDYKTN